VYGFSKAARQTAVAGIRAAQGRFRPFQARKFGHFRTLSLRVPKPVFVPKNYSW